MSLVIVIIVSRCSGWSIDYAVINNILSNIIIINNIININV